MSIQIFQEDGFGNTFDENGNEPVEMEVDSIQFPLGNITNYDSHMDLKPPEREVKMKEVKSEPLVKVITNKKTYTRYSNEKKHDFFELIYNKDYTVPEAAKKLNIPRRTAYDWFKKDQGELIENQTNRQQRKEDEKKKVGRLKILSDEHKQFLMETYNKNPQTTADEAVGSPISQFQGLKVPKTTVYDFMTKDCALTMKKAHFEFKDRNSEESIEARYNWVKSVRNTDIDYLGNYVFIDESGFNINLRRSMAWSKKGTRAVVVQNKTRVKTTTILEATSAQGIINIKVRIPYSESSKKRKLQVNLKRRKPLELLQVITSILFTTR